MAVMKTNALRLLMLSLLGQDLFGTAHADEIDDRLRDEYNLIKTKQSKLSRAQRDEVVRIIDAEKERMMNTALDNNIKTRGRKTT